MSTIVLVKGTNQITISSVKNGPTTWTASGNGIVTHTTMGLEKARSNVDRLLADGWALT